MWAYLSSEVQHKEFTCHEFFERTLPVIALHSLGLDNFCVMWDSFSEAHATGRQSPRETSSASQFFKIIFCKNCDSCH